MGNDIFFQDNSAVVLAELQNKIDVALEEIGMRAQTKAVALTPRDTGRLQNSITHTTRRHAGKTINYKKIKQTDGKIKYVEEKETVTIPEEEKNVVYLGTNVYYAPYIEYGTGIFADDDTGRKDPWSWTDKEGEKHPTKGIKPKHMFKKAIEDNIEEYKRVLENHLKMNNYS